MKISDMTNNQATEALIRLAEPISNICNDEEAVAVLDELAKMRKEPYLKVIGYSIPRFVTLLLKNHRRDVYEIVAALQQIPSSKVGTMNFKETVEAVQNSYDEILANFFPQFAGVRTTSGKESA